jgi:hypothetical protein
MDLPLEAAPKAIEIKMDSANAIGGRQWRRTRIDQARGIKPEDIC